LDLHDNGCEQSVQAFGTAEHTHICPCQYGCLTRPCQSLSFATLKAL